VQAGLAATEEEAFFEANAAARLLGIDTWDVNMQRLALDDSTPWARVTETADEVRMARVVQRAQELLPLEQLSSGPALEHGLGPAYGGHRILLFVVQGLGRHPGLGWPLIRAALRSPTIGARFQATQALGRWDRAHWDAETEQALRQAMESEPDHKIREFMARVLRGEPLEAEPSA
jgi:hypothetical protein